MPYVSHPGETADVRVTFKNELSEDFRLDAVLFGLDGEVIGCRDAAPASAEEADWVVAKATTPGEHTVEALARLLGTSGETYSGFVFEVRSRHRFAVGEQSTTGVTVVAWDRGKWKPLEERPRLRFMDTPGGAPK